MTTILIVDDEPLNRELLLAYLEGSGHDLIEAENGLRALELARERRPDLVLLDVMMPGMDGFEVTRRLKDEAGDEFLPIVLITALSDQRSRTAGLGVGADEFLTKPVDRLELGLRVANLIALRTSLQATRAREVALARQNVQLTELHRFKDEMTALLVHDLKSPLSVMLSNITFVQEEMSGMLGDSVEALQDAVAAAQRMSRLLANLLDLARIESSRLDLRREPVDISQLMKPIVHQRLMLARSRQIGLSLQLDAGLYAHVDADLVSRVLENLLDNAFRHTPRGGRIAVTARGSGGRAHIDVGNSGPPIPVEARELIFEKFGRATPGTGRMNLGLGLYFCRLAIEAHGGSLQLVERPDLPTVFVLDLPRPPAPSSTPAAAG